MLELLLVSAIALYGTGCVIIGYVAGRGGDE